ncbi:NAD(P)H-hydrate dehydratase [Parasphingorhabdus cellanae]|uniref:Bifunctional NAD(P)H-hydrate repair enzyme n=1 Tax=Parasphingorhabdus cellanae TaxID=2806553 RepID=A0ABX7T406_9SPHN|nr:NAD(P)H-hydrate dehydratase [Parasphingorhabdus cellanae]QTD56305.1 NAD(P)H-hydrate dehydratase [Parasphingorhabdus cellanae]
MLNHGHILTAAEMQAAEKQLIDSGASVIELMHRAGTGAADYIWRAAPHCPTMVLCGPGNNGGDGYVIAQALLEKGADVAIAASGEPATDAAKNAKSLWQGQTYALDDARPATQFVDCLFGTGLTRPVSGALLGHHQRLFDRAGRRVAVDLPSGIETDTGVTFNPVSRYDLTIALGAFKPAHYLAPACGLAGDLVGVDIGVDAASAVQLLARPTVKAPKTGDHKYTRGLVAVVAGRMQGAAKLTGLAAQRSGAGYVKVFAGTGVSSPSHSIVVEPHENGVQLQEQLSDDRIAIIVIGPGLGRDSHAEKLLDLALDIEKPVLLDADALILLSNTGLSRLKDRSSPVIMTPHTGEFAAIFGNDKGSKIDLTRKLAANSGAIVVHKGSDSVIADPEGAVSLASLSSSWLSTAGTGDVLAGMIAARFAVEKEAFLAGKQGQWLHSRAAKLAGPAFSPEILIDHIPKALQECL